MITFLCSPKPFLGPAKVHQYRAIQSWQAAVPGADIFLYGDSAGIDEAGADLGATVVRNVACATSRVPYFGAIADHASRYGKYDWQIYLNGDILLRGILSAFEQILIPQFLLIGERIDLDEDIYVDVSVPEWKTELSGLARLRQARLHGPTGIDYFAFNRGQWDGLQEVVVGRGGYDNALLAYCLRRRIPIIDGTKVVFALHQFHGYGHVSGGQKTVFTGSDAERNYAAAGGKHSAALISDADFFLQDGQLIHNPCHGDKLRHLELRCRFHYKINILGLVLRGLWRVLAAVGLRRIQKYDLEALVSP